MERPQTDAIGVRYFALAVIGGIMWQGSVPLPDHVASRAAQLSAGADGRFAPTAHRDVMLVYGVAMEIILTSVSDGLLGAWRRFCAQYPGVRVHDGSILEVECDAVVSPANSFGFMDGGVDALYLKRFGSALEDAVQAMIGSAHGGELVVGTTEVVDKGGVIRTCRFLGARRGGRRDGKEKTAFAPPGADLELRPNELNGQSSASKRPKGLHNVVGSRSSASRRAPQRGGEPIQRVQAGSTT